MALNFWNALVGRLFPEYFAGRFIERINLPSVFRIVFHWSDVAEESEASLVLAGSDCAHDEYLVSPHHWTRVRQTRDLSFPTDVQRGWGVKLHRLRRSLGASGRARTTKLWP